jgi:anti-sigma B factor antagonist
VNDSDIRVVQGDRARLKINAPGLTVTSAVGCWSSRVAVSGELDMATVPAFELVIDHLLGAGPPRVKADLADLRFLSAAGITAFEVTSRRCDRHGGWFRLEHVGARVRRLLELVGSERLLTCDHLDN